jgi:transcriptional regulator with XRE-family HTH domain
VWTFAEYLRHERLSRNLTMEVLARGLGISPQFISLLENGRRHPSAGLVARASDVFGADPNYVGFLAQRMPVEQKRALAESPTAPDYIPTALRACARSADGEEMLLRQLLLPEGARPPEHDAPYYTADPLGRTPVDSRGVRAIVGRIMGGDAAFSPKARAWAAFHTAYLTRITDGRVAALPAWEALASGLDEDTSRPYGPSIRRLVAMQLTLGLQEIGQASKAEAQATRAAGYAADADDPDAVACAAFTIAAIRAAEGDPTGAASSLAGAAGLTGVSSAGRARCLTALAQVLSAAHEYARARDVAAEAAPLLRTTAVDIPTPERSGMLFATQAVGAEALAELGDLDSADEWLNRARSLRPRALPDATSDARIAVATGLVFIARNRGAMARRRVAPLLVDQDLPTHMTRRALRVEGQAVLLANDYAAAHVASTQLLARPATGVAIQDLVAVGWGLLTRCEAFLGEGRAAAAADALTSLVGRMVAACEADRHLQGTTALVSLRADIAALRTRVDGG